MAAVKMTFSLDERTAMRLRQAAERQAKPQSEIVREAIDEYAARLDRLSETERRRLLRAFDELVPAIPRRPQREVRAELEELRRTRRAGGRKGSQRA